MTSHTWLIFVALAAVSVAACTGSPTTLAMRPGFNLSTPTGIASVSIRDSTPGLTDADFVRLVEYGMKEAMSGTEINEQENLPSPSRRFVWHVLPNRITEGTSRLVVNVFAGSVPFAYEQETVDDSASRAMMIDTVASLTR